MDNVVTEEDLSKKIQEIESACANSKHGQRWKLTNDISGRKSSAKGQMRGASQKEQVMNWNSQFKGPSRLPTGHQWFGWGNIINTHRSQYQNITGPFDQDEYEKAKKSLVEGKSCGVDNIPPEVLKRCGLDDIILGFCNDVLLNRNAKPVVCP